MAKSLVLPHTRFICQTSTRTPRHKSGYLAMAAENAEALSRCDWRKASPGSVNLPYHDFLATSHFDDSYDAYKMTGNYSPEEMTEVAYAGMVAYRFTLPPSYREGEATLVAAHVHVTRDRYLLSGVRLAAHLSNLDTPSVDWSVVRGENSPHSVPSALDQSACPYLTASMPDADSFAIPLAGADSTAKTQYLWVYLTIENYTDVWKKYSAKEDRLYAIEGAAMLVASASTVEFSADVSPDTTGVNNLPANTSPTFLQPQEVVAVAEASSATAALNAQGGILSQIPPYIALADLAVQVVSANTQNSERPPQEVFADLLAAATAKTKDDVVAEAAAPSSTPIPLAQCDRLTILPRLILGANPPAQMPAQTGLSVWFNVPLNYSRATIETTDDQGNPATIHAVKNPAFIQSSALVLKAVTSGRNLTLSGVVAANTGVNLRIAVWHSLKSPVWSSSIAHSMASILVAHPTLHRSTTPGDTVYSKEKSLVKTAYQDLGPIPSATASLVGISPLVYGEIAAEDSMFIPLHTAVEPGDILILVPVIDSITPADGQTSYHFGRQADPAIHSADHGGIWGRYPENLGWFPAVNIY